MYGMLKNIYMKDLIMVEYAKIVSIEEVGEVDMIDIEVTGNRLFYANDILTHNSGYGNSDVELTDTAESFGLPATADLMFALVSTEDMEQLNQLMVKQLKNRYNDPTIHKRFVVGIDRAKMRLYNVEESAQTLHDDTPVFSSSRSGQSMDSEKKNRFKALTV